MPQAVAFVRGINVGGKILRMADLKAICEELGLEDVRTFLQSGNVVFRTRKAGPKIERELEGRIRSGKSMDVRVMVRSRDELASAIEASPFGEESRKDPSHTILVFLERAPAPGAFDTLRAAHSGSEPMHLDGRHLYIFYGGGMGTSKLTPALYERKLGVAGTARNWNTVTKLLAMLG